MPVFRLFVIILRKLRYWDTIDFLNAIVQEIFFLVKYRRYGLNYLFALDNDELDFSEELREHATIYSPAPYAFIRRAFKFLGDRLFDKTFVDVGCGAGRVLVLAAEQPFGRIIGVELSPTLAAMARKNVERFERTTTKPHPSIEIFQASALDFTFPDNDLIIFLYDPFDDIYTEKLIRKIGTAGRCEKYVVYISPCAGRLFVENKFREIYRKANKHNCGFSIFYKKG